MKNIIFILLAITFFNCNNTSTPSSSEQFLQVFHTKKTSNDTLHFHNDENRIKVHLLDSIVEGQLPVVIFEELSFQVGDAQYQPFIKFPLDENHIACIMNTDESWYQKQSLIVFDKITKTYDSVIPLSQLYGGDGGQIVNESWIFKEGNQTFLYAIESSHSTVMVGANGEPEEFLYESSQLYLWNGDSFLKTALKDSTQLAETFKLNWKW